MIKKTSVYKAGKTKNGEEMVWGFVHHETAAFRGEVSAEITNLGEWGIQFV